MKHLLIIFSLLLTSVSWSKDVYFDNLVERGGLYYEKYTNEPFTGKTIGDLQGKIKDGKLEGEWLEYYNNGELLAKSNYKDGKKQGEYVVYYKNGGTDITGNFKEGKKEGEWLSYYYKSGQLFNKNNYKDGKKHGEQLLYYSNGQYMKKSYYKEGKKAGKWNWYNRDGDLTITHTYKDDKLIEKIEH